MDWELVYKKVGKHSIISPLRSLGKTSQFISVNPEAVDIRQVPLIPSNVISDREHLSTAPSQVQTKTLKQIPMGKFR